MLHIVYIVKKYTAKSSRFVKEQNIIHPYLKSNLINTRIQQLSDFQIEMLQASNQNKNCFLNSCTGSGKTLAYLIPLLNQIFYSKENKNLDKNIHGAIILTLNKELVLQIYRSIRKLDPQGRISVKRTGPISHYLPVVTQLNNHPKTEDEADQIDRKINENLINTIKWSTTDILVSTPQMLHNIISLSSKKQPLSPNMIVIDEADVLLQLDKNVSLYTDKIIANTAKNEKLQFLIAASSFPNKINKINSVESLMKRFNGLQFIKGQNQHQIPENIQLFFVEVKQNKRKYMLDILQKKKNSRMIIFCNNKKSIDEVNSLITNELESSCLCYHASLDSNQRSRVLHRFQNAQSKILVSTDLGSRGLDFQVPIDLIMEYDMAENITGFINRVGRTGRNSLPGQVITLVEENKKQFFEHLQDLLSKNQRLDELFSRKRSYRKLYKQ